MLMPNSLSCWISLELEIAATNHPHLDLMLLVFAGILEVGEEGDSKSF